MKISKITSLILAGSAFILIGCGSGGGDSSDSTTSTKITKVKASDAYVVALPDPATIKLANGNSYATTKVDSNGTIVFDNIPADANLTGAKVHIPNSAIVDTDGDGNLSSGDQTIRMPLSVRYGEENNSNIVANPLTTVAVEKNDDEVLKDMSHFDPVQAKLQLIQNYDEKLAKLVALNDAVANAVKNAETENEDTQNVINNINIENLKDIINNPSVDVNTTLQTALNNVDDQEAIQKATEVITLAQDVNKLVEEGKISPHEGVIALIAVSDANVSADKVKTALENDNIEEIIHSLPTDEKVQIHLAMKEKEDMEKHDDMDDDDYKNNMSYTATTDLPSMDDDDYKNEMNSNDDRTDNKTDNIQKHDDMDDDDYKNNISYTAFPSMDDDNYKNEMNSNDDRTDNKKDNMQKHNDMDDDDYKNNMSYYDQLPLF